ncbi:MAG: Enoyl-CoA hydratase/carnithine racemase [Frankiales bacterium]|nr:Enoyl-CoA hydratase/carnithine racemase [Frankiales bacterium]
MPTYAQFTTLQVTVDSGVAEVVLDRPKALNAFDEVMIEELHSCWRAFRGDDDVRAVVLTGSGDKAFCTGIDRNAAQVGVAGRRSAIGQQGATPLHFDDPGERISPKSGADLWKPVVAAVNGMACGGAFYLLGEVDVIIAAEHATFFDPHVTYGMAAVFEPMAMLQRMPLGEVLRMSLMGVHERVSAQRALDIGLVSEVVPADDLRVAARQVAAVIAGQPPLAVQMTVRAIWQALNVGYRQALDLGKVLVQLGSDEASLAEGQQLFASGARPSYRLR